MVTNPLDVMSVGRLRTSPASRASRHRHGRRARHARATATFIARSSSLGEDVRAMVLGGHGDTMVPLVSLHHGERHPADATSCSAGRLDALVDRARNGGAEIVKHAQHR